MRILPSLLRLILAARRLPAAAPDPRGVGRDETLLTVTATGRADTRPDEARLQLGVQSVAATSDEASRLNREKMEKVTDRSDRASASRPTTSRPATSACSASTMVRGAAISAPRISSR